MKISPNSSYKGLEVYKSINNNAEECINFFREQIKYNGDYSGEIIIKILDKLEKYLKLELD